MIYILVSGWSLKDTQHAKSALRSLVFWVPGCRQSNWKHIHLLGDRGFDFRLYLNIYLYQWFYHILYNKLIICVYNLAFLIISKFSPHRNFPVFVVERERIEPPPQGGSRARAFQDHMGVVHYTLEGWSRSEPLGTTTAVTSSLALLTFELRHIMWHLMTQQGCASNDWCDVSCWHPSHKHHSL